MRKISVFIMLLLMVSLSGCVEKDDTVSVQFTSFNKTYPISWFDNPNLMDEHEKDWFFSKESVQYLSVYLNNDMGYEIESLTYNDVTYKRDEFHENRNELEILLEVEVGSVLENVEIVFDSITYLKDDESITTEIDDQFDLTLHVMASPIVLDYTMTDLSYESVSFTFDITDVDQVLVGIPFLTVYDEDYNKTFVDIDTDGVTTVEGLQPGSEITIYFNANVDDNSSLEVYEKVLGFVELIIPEKEINETHHYVSTANTIEVIYDITDEDDVITTPSVKVEVYDGNVLVDTKLSEVLSSSVTLENLEPGNSYHVVVYVLSDFSDGNGEGYHKIFEDIVTTETE